ncbi:MAG TPA: NUDIX domain-containing protein [Thermoplasmata archaeon]|nr:NUDIX domain-containing protein [Thermoplasmata archaeon]
MSVNVATLPITVGVGAFLTRGDRLLVVRRTYGALKGLWTIPSGYVEPAESVVTTLERELLEETGITGRVGALLGVRHRVAKGINDTFLVFRMEYVSGEARPDGQEVSAAAFVPMSELASAEESAPFTKAMIAHVPTARGLTLNPYRPPGRRVEGESYLLYL